MSGFQVRYFRYFTLCMCGALELVQWGARTKMWGARTKMWGAQTRGDRTLGRSNRNFQYGAPFLGSIHLLYEDDWGRVSFFPFAFSQGSNVYLKHQRIAGFPSLAFNFCPGRDMRLLWRRADVYRIALRLQQNMKL